MYWLAATQSQPAEICFYNQLFAAEPGCRLPAADLNPLVAGDPE